MRSNGSRLMLIVLLALAMLLAAGVTLAQDATEEATPEPAAQPQTTPEAAPTEGGEIAAAAPANTGLITALRHTHSLVRWIVVLVAVVAVVKLGLGLLQNAAFDPLTRRIMLAFSGAITLQWAVGLVFLVVLGSATGFGLRHYWEHLAVMTLAVGLSHRHNRWKNAPDRRRYRSSLLIVVIVLALVFVGVALLPQGWRVFPT